MRKHRDTALGGQSEHVNHFQPRRSGCVLDAHPNRQSSRIQLRAQALPYGFDLLRCGRLVGRWSALRQDLRNSGVRDDDRGRKWRAEHHRARRRVTGCRAVVDQRMSVLLLKEAGHVGNADFQFERGGHAVKRFHAPAVVVLAVLVKVDEAGRNHQALCAEDALPCQRVGRDACDLAISDADIARGIEARLGIHDSSAFEYEVILLGERSGGKDQAQCDQRRKENCFAHGTRYYANWLRITNYRVSKGAQQQGIPATGSLSSGLRRLLTRVWRSRWLRRGWHRRIGWHFSGCRALRRQRVVSVLGGDQQAPAASLALRCRDSCSTAFAGWCSPACTGCALAR